MHVRLRPGLRQVWRGPQTVQIGLGPPHAAVLDGVTRGDAALLDRLATGVHLAELDAGAVPAGPARGRELLRLLAEAGVLLTEGSGRAALARLGEAREQLAPDAAAWALAVDGAGDGWELLARRTARHVVVRGGGRTAACLAATLAAAGVGVGVDDDARVTPADVHPLGARPHDVGTPRGPATARALARIAALPLPRGAGEATEPPDMVVLVSAAAADAEAGAALLNAGVAHLSVVVREVDVVVGPLVVPREAPCLRCLDLHRSDRDPRWPHVLAQLLARTGSPLPSTEETALATVAGGIAALQVLTHLDGRVRPAAVGATLEVELPHGLGCRRPWPAHPSCGCTRLAAPGSIARAGAAPGRMAR